MQRWDNDYELRWRKPVPYLVSIYLLSSTSFCSFFFAFLIIAARTPLSELLSEYIASIPLFFSSPSPPHLFVLPICVIFFLSGLFFELDYLEPCFCSGMENGCKWRFHAPTQKSVNLTSFEF